MKKYTFLLSIIIILLSCNRQNPINKFEAKHYPNLLDISYVPESKSGTDGCFSDLGSWFAFTPAEKQNPIGGFCGPFFFDTYSWSSKSLANLVIFKPGSKTSVNFSLDSAIYYPGSLNQILSAGLCSIDQKLIFITKNTALIRTNVKKPKEYRIRWQGKLFNEKTKLFAENNILIAERPNKSLIVIIFPENINIEINKENNSYFTKGEKFNFISISYFNNKNEYLLLKKKLDESLSDPEKLFAENSSRWNNYLKSVLRNDMPEKFNKIAVKSIMTLISNWRSAKGDLFHDGVIPSHAVYYFVGFWAWDSWKHAVALAHFAPELAKDQIRAMFDYQDANGMVIDCIFANKNENNPRDTKPPLAAWALMEVFKETNDTAFVKEMYPKLEKYYNWWFKNRDYDKNGICEFGSIDGTTEAAKWESGMDNAVRFDDAVMFQNNESAWSFDQESVDLNSYLALEYKLLKELSKISGNKFEAIEIDGAKIANYFFCKEAGYFFDKKIQNGNFIKDEGPEGYTPIWTGIASIAQAKKVSEILLDSTKFACFIPFPTLSTDNPKYSKDSYWRGPIWLDQTYFAISGLRKYGFMEEADKFTENVFNRLEGLNSGEAIFENYDPQTGKHLRAPHFSWSAAHLLMLYWEFGK